MADDPQVRGTLGARRGSLSAFWLTARAGRTAGSRQDTDILVVDAEDSFTAMLAHMLRALGARATVMAYDHPRLASALTGHRGPVVLGPGPGNPLDPHCAKISALDRLTRHLLTEHRPLLTVCLGQQLLARALGLDLLRLPEPRQGAQLDIDFFGTPERSASRTRSPPSPSTSRSGHYPPAVSTSAAIPSADTSTPFAAPVSPECSSTPNRC